MISLLVAAALLAFGLKVAHDTREHDRLIRSERERFEHYIIWRAER